MRILIVEDDPALARSLVRYLGSASPAYVPDYVLAVGSYAAGLSRISAERWDCIISDNDLGDGKGTDLLARAFVGQPSALLILHTGSGIAECEYAHSIVRKPDNTGVIRRLIENFREARETA